MRGGSAASSTARLCRWSAPFEPRLQSEAETGNRNGASQGGARIFCRRGEVFICQCEKYAARCYVNSCTKRCMTDSRTLHQEKETSVVYIGRKFPNTPLT